MTRACHAGTRGLDRLQNDPSGRSAPATRTPASEAMLPSIDPPRSGLVTLTRPPPRSSSELATIGCDTGDAGRAERLVRKEAGGERLIRGIGEVGLGGPVQ